MVGVPVEGEEVIVDDVDDDSGVAAAFWGEEFFGFVEGWVGVSEAVDGSVGDDAVYYFWGVFLF